MGRVASSNLKDSTVVTYMKQTSYTTVACNDSCTTPDYEKILEGHCRTTQSHNFIMVGVENLNYAFSHKIISFLFI